MDIPEQVLLDFVEYIYSIVSSWLQFVLPGDQKALRSFNELINLNKGFLVSALDFEGNIPGDYAYGYIQEEKLFLTLNMVDYFYFGSPPYGHVKNQDTLDKNVKNMAFIANQGLEYISRDISHELEGEINLDDIYTMLLSQVSSEFDTPTFTFDTVDDAVFVLANKTAVALKITFIFDMIDERAYQVGGYKYIEGEKRFNKNK